MPPPSYPALAPLTACRHPLRRKGRRRLAAATAHLLQRWRLAEPSGTSPFSREQKKMAAARWGWRRPLRLPVPRPHSWMARSQDGEWNSIQKPLSASLRSVPRSSKARDQANSRRQLHLAGRRYHDAGEQAVGGCPGLADRRRESLAKTRLERLDQRLADDRIVMLLDAVADVAPGEILDGGQHGLGAGKPVHDEAQGRHQLGALLAHVGYVKQRLEAAVDCKQLPVEQSGGGGLDRNDLTKTILHKLNLVGCHLRAPRRFLPARGSCPDVSRGCRLWRLFVSGLSLPGIGLQELGFSLLAGGIDQRWREGMQRCSS